MVNNTLSPKHPNVKFELRPSQERGNADHGWLKTFHTFSFANYYDGKYDSFGALRVINEDRVKPSTGFGTHSHSEFEIFSYVVAGELEHKDSMGNLEILKRGDLQMTSAGTGIRHSEKCAGNKPVHFLQIWAKPQTGRLPPKYYTRHFTDDEKRDKLVRIVAPSGADGVSDEREGSGPAPVHAQLSLYATLLSKEKTVTHAFGKPVNGSAPRKAFVQVIQTSGYNPSTATGSRVRLNGGLELGEGDGTFAWAKEGEKIDIENIGDKTAEVLVFDIE
jgi:hypothetical protein